MSTCGNYGGAKNTFTTNGNNKYTIARSVPGTALPETPSLTRDIGSSDYPFDNLYVNEIHVTSDNTIYLGTKGLKLTSTDAGEFNLIMDTPTQENNTNNTTTLKFTSTGISSSVKTTDTSTGNVTETDPTVISGGGTSSTGTSSTGTSSEIESLQSQITTLTSLKAPKISPTFTGIPLAPTAISSTNTTQIATTEFVKTVIEELINNAPETLDTLKELAAAFSANESAITTTANLIGEKLPISTYNTDKTTIDGNITTNTNAISAHAGRLTTLENLDIQSQIDTIVAVDVVQQNTLDIKANISNQTMDNLTSRQTINIAEKILPLTVSSNVLTANYANGAVFFVSNLTAAANWECLVTNVNPTSSTGCSNVITLLIDASVYQTFAATCKINGTTRTLQFAGGIDAVDMTGATTICQTISVIYNTDALNPVAVMSSVVPFF